MTMILRLFAGRGLSIALVAGLLVTVLAWDRGRLTRAKEAGRTEERASVDKRGAVNAQKADAARRAADRLPATRLLDKHCRDC